LTLPPDKWDTVEDFKIAETLEELATSTCDFCKFFGAIMSEHQRKLGVKLPHPNMKLSQGWNMLPRNMARLWLEYRFSDRHGYDGQVQINYVTPINGRVLPVQSSGIPYERIKAWIRDCKEHDPYELASGEKVKGLKVICCGSEPQVVSAPDSCRYVALSYVWGNSTETPFGTGDRIGANVPQTISDSIKVTLELGYKYLWVDRYV
jgi:hypothetical protein